MLQIRPNENLPLVYLISDPNDSGVYYIQAVIRNSATGVTIKTVNLTGSGRRFTATTQAPSDVSGQGTYIDITISVYTDSGYTTFSANYQNQVTQYLVAERWNFAFGGNGGGGASVDYKKLQQMIESEVEKVVIPPAKEIDLSHIKETLGTIYDSVRSIVVSPIDLSSLERQISSLTQAIKEIPQTDKVDLYPVIGAIQNIAETLESFRDENKKLKNGMSDSFTESMKKSNENLREFVKEMKEIKDTPFHMSYTVPEKKYEYDDSVKKLLNL